MNPSDPDAILVIEAMQREMRKTAPPRPTMNRCKTCKHWQQPVGFNEGEIAVPRDQDTLEPMARGFEARICRHPDQAQFEAPIRADGFALTDSSQYFAAMATGEDFGCVLHEVA